MLMLLEERLVRIVFKFIYINNFNLEQHIYQRTGNMPITDPSQSIANFDLNAAAQMAAQAASINVKRPDYGALAAVLPSQQQRENMAPLQFVDYQQSHQHRQQQLNWGFLGQRDSLAPMSMCNNDNMYTTALNAINHQKKNCLSNLDNYFLGNGDSVSNTSYPSQQLLQKSNNNNNINGNAQLLRSESSSHSASENLFNSTLILFI